MNSRIRFIIIAFLLIGIAYCLVAKHFNLSIYLLGVAGYFVWSQYREGSVFLATQAFHKKDYERTRRLLAEIKNPDHLRKGRRNFYEFMQGNIALKDNKIDEAEVHFQLASRLPWKRDHEKAMVLINLANINLRKKKYSRVKSYIEVVEKLKLTARQEDIIEKIKTEVIKYN